MYDRVWIIAREKAPLKLEALDARGRGELEADEVLGEDPAWRAAPVAAKPARRASERTRRRSERRGEVKWPTVSEG